MIKFLVSDLDGTLFYGHGDSLFDLADENRKMMAKLANNEDITFCVASGRNIYYGLHLMEKYHNKSRLLCGYNGASIYDNGKVFEEYLDISLIEKIYEISKKFTDIQDFQLLTSSGDRVFANACEEVITVYQIQMDEIGHGKVSPLSIEEYMNSDKNDVLKVTINFTTKEATNHAYNLLASVSDDATVTSSGGYTVEVNTKKRNKGSFIDYVMENYDVTKEEIAVVGDAFNDVDMFKAVTNSLCMSHASDVVKGYAKYIVNNVAECYEMILDINKNEVSNDGKGNK